MTRRAFPVLLSTVLLATGCFLFPREEEVLAPPLMEPPEISYELYTAQRGSIVDDFRVTGVLVYAQQQNVYFRYRGGRLLKIYASYADVVKAGQLLAELDTDSLKHQVAVQEIGLAKARLQAERANLMGQDRIQRDLSALDVRLAELDLEASRTELGKAQLYSPVDGVVVFVGRFAEGDSVDAYETVVRVADPTVMELAYDGIRASDFAFGATVEVVYGDRVLLGTVVRTPGTAPVDLPEDERRKITVRVRNLPASAEAGETATIRVVLQRRDNVIVIPRNLVQTYQGADFVNVLEGSVRRQQPVERGVVSATEAEIVEGLNEGDQVIVR